MEEGHEICHGCGSEIDPDTCWCGDPKDNHGNAYLTGHDFVPMGCDCFREVQSMEAGLVFDDAGAVISWHTPADRSKGLLPDSKSLWDTLWENREHLGGVAHTHPWHGNASPSSIDITTFAAIEAALGKRLIWPIVTFSAVSYFAWNGPGELDYVDQWYENGEFRLSQASIDELRRLSR